ncbi:MAG: hypothetical protein FWC08_13590 [Defluviitaleaceae bacterium]|nr:hypothetical protein [Defluviitaleaceae bacterium]
MRDNYDFANAVKNPHYGKFIKNGKFTVEVEHEGYNEVFEVDIKTGTKVKLDEYKVNRTPPKRHAV